ncbi:helix-turn-helix domain-containing protein [Mycobacterium attenuatum]|uniref:helix-turn-helix domain-containing protein n=1 Tax=Mycobacterium attenuatum TaxID=2341086 RepID=UPI001B7D4B79|nr:helix-turn-helix transcriptional regulator [Mycobacterium attenuatum]
MESDDETVAGKEPEYGPTAKTVAENITRLRDFHGFSYTRLSERLEMLEWPLSPVAVRRIENCQRRVTVDDLVAFALALRVSPATLLMPKVVEDQSPDNVVAITAGSAPAVSTRAENVWDWLTAQAPIVRTWQLLTFGSRAWPSWIREKYAGDLYAASERARQELRGDLLPDRETVDGDD